ncbi:MAG: glycosyltransferase family 4 protein, partial [Chloroflexi bacterium]|nr:glycosyltransferase family 4 protein [Chloroflexota bacterium]
IRIAQQGAGGMYCGACARDVTLITGLISRGHDVQVVPLYTPLRLDAGVQLPITPIFYGGINVFLQQLSPIFRYIPAFMDRWLDNPALLRWASKSAVKTRPQELGAMTVSVLSGRDGRQRKELHRLMRYLESEVRPDIINITNSLLSGIAPEPRRSASVPIVCTLQGEDSFVEAIPEPQLSQALGLMRKHASAIDLYLSPGEGYAAKMAEFLDIPKEKIRITRPGIDVNAFKPTAERHRNPFVIGYLSAITPVKGLDILVEAFSILVNDQGRDARLRVAGRILNEEYWNSITKTIADKGLEARFEHIGEPDFTGKIEFLKRCGVFSVPSLIGESRGMAVMEAMASGVPVVVPDTGVFPELLSLTNGGLLFKSGDAESLAGAIAKIMDDPDAADTTGRSAAEGVAKHYSAEKMAERVLEEYTKLLSPPIPAFART